MDKIKVVTGVIGTGKGGMSRFAVNLFKNLDPERFDVTFLSNVSAPYFGPEIEKHGGHIAVIASRGRHPLRHKSDLKRIMDEGHFDVCHIHLSTASNIDPLIAAKKAGIPLVIAHSHNSAAEAGAAAKLLHRINAPKIARFTDKRLACSGLAGQFMFCGADFTVVKNAIDLERFAYSPEMREKMRRELGLGSAFTLGHMGRMSMQKNPIFLVEAFAEVVKLKPDSRFLYVGEGPMEPDIRRRAEELGVLDKMVFTGGMVDNPQDYLCAMDCYLLPSLFEGLGFVVIESVCSGLCCFASDVIPEEARVGELVETFPLDIDKALLARRILERQAALGERREQRALLQNLHYDMASQKAQMEAIYSGKR